MNSTVRHVDYLNKPLYEEVLKAANKKFSKNSYAKSLWILETYKAKKGNVKYSGPHQNKVNKESKAFEISTLGEENETKAVLFNFLHESVAGINEDIKKFFDSFQTPGYLKNPITINNTYKPMEPGKQIMPESSSIADNEDGVLNDPKPLGKNGGSSTYSGGRNSSGQPTGESMPTVKDDGYTVKSSDDDSLEDFIEWVQPLQNEIDGLRACLADIWSVIQSQGNQINYQSSDFWNYVSKHGQGHLPPVKSISQMSDALKTLGLDKDYVIYPQTIYASDGKVSGMNIKLIAKKK
jgi:hypothetical protein